MINESESIIDVSIIDQGNDEISNVYLYLLRYDITSNTYRIVEMAKT